MRGTGKHFPPSAEIMQDAPQDNTSRFVMDQVDLFWAETFAAGNLYLIHTESAREIAAWFASGNNGHAVFASTGEITEDYHREIADDWYRAGHEGETDTSRDERRQLTALLEYVRESERIADDED